MGDFGSSLVRTLVPVTAGFIITVLLNLGVELDESGAVALNAFLTSLFSALYYLVARFMETKVGAQWGWLLGLPKGPTY